MVDDPLDLATRRAIYAHVERHPGKYLREIQRDLGFAMGMLEHHLRELERARLVVVVHGENKRFFPQGVPAAQQALLALLRQSLPRRIMLLLLEQGSTRRTDLAASLRVPQSTLNYHLGKLRDHGLVLPRKEGRDVVYAVVDASLVVTVLTAYRASFLDRVVDAFLDGIDAVR